MAAGNAIATLTRAGFAARGILYIVIALLVITTGHAEDQSGAMRYLESGFGKWLLILMTAGFIAYGLWRLSDAALNIEGHEQGAKGAGERIAAGGSGLVYLFFAWRAVRLVQHASGGGGGAASKMQGNHTMLVIAGLILLGVGVFQLVKAAKASFCKNLGAGVANEHWVKLTGRIGYGARAIVFLIGSYFLLRAGFGGGGNAKSAGVDHVLSWLDSPWDMVVAAGLLMFGLFSFIEARFRRIHPVPVEGVAQQLRSKVGLQ